MLRIALTYELRQDFLALGHNHDDVRDMGDVDITDDVAAGLENLGHQVTRMGDFKTVLGYLAKDDIPFDIFFNIAEGMYGSAREAQIPGVLEALRMPFTFSDAAVLSLCLDKAKTKMVLQHFSIPTSPFAVIANDASPCPTSAASAIALSPHADALSQYPLFAKPTAEGNSKGVLPGSKIRNPEELETCVAALCARYPGRAIMVERFLPGTEYTVGIVGTGVSARVLGVTRYQYHKREGLDFMCDTVKSSDIALYVTQVATSMDDPEVAQAAETGLRAYRAIGLRDAGRVDVRVDERGVVNVMELNPLCCLKRDFSALPNIATRAGWSYERLLQEILDSAMERHAVAGERSGKSGSIGNGV